MNPQANSAALVRPAALPSPEDLEGLSTGRLRSAFLVRGLFHPGELRLARTGLDRMIVGAALPSGGDLLLEGAFTGRREVGILNLADEGVVAVGADRFELGRLDCLYAGRGAGEIRFLPSPSGQPAFYFCAAPAHASYPTARMRRAEANLTALGRQANASRRRILKYIWPGGIPSCQLVMGFTELEEGSVWNTMPPHTHSRRSEIYLYFDLGDNLLFHIMGTPAGTRHLVVRDREAVLSPEWSIHAGAGTAAYRFVWAMAGENQDFADMDPVGLSELA